jgi:hypothetical protein
MSFTMGLIVDGTKIGAPNYLPPSKFGAQFGHYCVMVVGPFRNEELY